MDIILKHTFKNIFKKSGRTFLLTFCIFMCSLAAVLCLDMSKSLERMFANMMTDMVGSSDILLVSDEKFPDDWQEGLPKLRYMSFYGGGMTLHRRDPELYSYAIDDNLSIMGFDLKKAYEMKLLLTKLDLKPNETAMTEEIAGLYGYKEGDKINFYDTLGEKSEFTIVKIIKKGGIIHTDSCIISEEALEKLYSKEIKNYGSLVIDINDDKLIDKAYDTLKNKYPEMTIENIKNSEDVNETMDDLSNLFLTVFAVCLIVVIIITMTVSERIMSERLPVAGTLRSLGVSRGKTAFILLLENIIYALMGSLPAILVYSLLRDPAINTMFTIEGEIAPDFGTVSPITYFTVVFGAVTVECLCTLKETFFSSRMAIRDIIFQGHDSEYKFSGSKTVIGIVCLVTAVVCAFFDGKFYPLIISFVCGVIGVYLLFPYVTVYSSKALSRLFTKMNMPVAGIAGTEISVRKSTVASTALIAVSAGIAIAVFIFSDSMSAVNSYREYDCDIIVTAEDEDFMYDYIDDLEGVAETQNVHESISVNEIEVNGKKFKEYSIFAVEEGDMFSGVIGIDEPVKENEIYISEDIARKTGVKTGDEIELALNCEFFIPDYLKVKVAGICNCVYMDSCGKGIAINVDMYRNFIGKYDSRKLIRVNGDKDEIISKIRKYSAFDDVDSVQTIEKYYEEVDKENHSENTMIKMFGFIGIILTFVGVVSNQLIGFEGRKRENAVLLSTSMNRNVLRKMLLLETFISSALSLLCAVPFGILIHIPINKIMICFQTDVPPIYNFAEIFAVSGILLALFSLTVIFPYAALRKMKLSEQLKYE